MERHSKPYLFYLFLFLLCLIPLLLGIFQNVYTLKVACVGDSITYGAKLEDRIFESYPARLQQFLGADYLVKNFGASGYTLQKDGNFPYWDHPNFQKSSDFQPDIVLIMLGTNDTKPYNWSGTEAFLSDYRDLIAHYQDLESSPQIILMTPATVFPQSFQPSDAYQMQEDVADIIAAAVRKLAREEDLPLIDIHTATASHPEYFFLDGVHPDSAGAREIARLASQAVKELSE